MSQQVPLEQLQVVSTSYGPAAYVIAAGGRGAPRITHARVGWAEGDLLVEVGRSACRALAADPVVTVLWAATEREPMSLIVDGRVDGVPPVDGGEVRIRPTGAVRHRAAPG